ncbi:aminoglycoside phosphotransferase family protein [Propionibacteriaceae bacterium Y2011]|uniref:aminoglycoside phosphotransferase family protein n=1 Tax=Microlunatus sp. Y2014 TaxID=3418488 RepID=UPI003B4B8B08
MPAGLDAQRSLGARWVDWLDRLPKLAVDVLTDWELTRTGAPTHGFCSLVLPVRTADGTPTMLKLSLADDVESAYEHLALQAWHPTSVELLRADPRRRAMLLERLDPTDLRSVDDLTACQVVAETYSRLHLPALPQLDLLTDHVGGWLDDLAALPAGAPLPRRLVEHALSRGRDLVADPDSTGVIIHGDLHYENVLSADRGWVVIDPKPMSGDPHYEPAPMLWDRWDELQAGGDVAGGLRRRFATLVDTAGLDLARARDWVVVRMVLNANWTLEDAAGRPLTREQQDWITMCVTVATVIGSDW